MSAEAAIMESIDVMAVEAHVIGGSVPLEQKKKRKKYSSYTKFAQILQRERVFGQNVSIFAVGSQLAESRTSVVGECGNRVLIACDWSIRSYVGGVAVRSVRGVPHLYQSENFIE